MINKLTFIKEMTWNAIKGLDASSIQSLFIKIPNLQNRTNPVYKCWISIWTAIDWTFLEPRRKPISSSSKYCVSKMAIESKIARLTYCIRIWLPGAVSWLISKLHYISIRQIIEFKGGFDIIFVLDEMVISLDIWFLNPSPFYTTVK